MGYSLGYCNSINCADSVYFVGNDSLFGKVDKASGNVELIDTCGYEISNVNILSSGKSIYMVQKGGNALIEYNTSDGKWKRKRFHETIHLSLDKGLALIFLRDDKIWVFPRDGNEMISYDLLTDTLDSKKCDIEDSPVWACRFKDIVYLLTIKKNTGMLDLFSLELTSNKVRRYDVTLDSRMFKGRLAYPVHHMNCDEKRIYFFDSKNIFCLDIETADISTIYTSESHDIGSRIIVIGAYIVVFPWSGNDFYILNKENGQIENVKSAPYQNAKELLTNYSSMNEYCEDEYNFFCLSNYSDMMLCIEKRTLEFVWKRLNFDRTNVKNVRMKKEVMHECSVFSCNDLLQAIFEN